MKVPMEVVLRVLDIAAEFGIPALQQILKTWNKSAITMQDLDELKEKVKKPDDYF